MDMMPLFPVMSLLLPIGNVSINFTLAVLPAIKVRTGSMTETTSAIFQLTVKAITKPVIKVVK